MIREVNSSAKKRDLTKKFSPCKLKGQYSKKNSAQKENLAAKDSSRNLLIESLEQPQIISLSSAQKTYSVLDDSKHDEMP